MSTIGVSTYAFILRIIGRNIYNYSTIFSHDVIVSSGCKASLPLRDSPATQAGLSFVLPPRARHGRARRVFPRTARAHPSNTITAARVPAGQRLDGFHNTRAASSGSWRAMRLRATAVGPTSPVVMTWRGSGHSGTRPLRGTASSIAQYRLCRTIRIYS